MNELTIGGTTIRQDSVGRYLINDLHKAAGGESKHQPHEWLRLDQTEAMVEALRSESDPGITGSLVSPIETVKGNRSGQVQGTFVVKELVYSYAMWISPAFHLKVIRAYDAMVTGGLGHMTPAEQALYHAQRLVDHERKMLALQAEQEKTAARMTELEEEHATTAAQLEALVEGEGYYTVVGYAKRRHIGVDAGVAAALGKVAAKLCREKNRRIGSAPHPVYGRVNSYPVDVLDRIFDS